jgi:hypothetical protein
MNQLLDRIENMHKCQKDMINQFDSELLGLLSQIEEKEDSKENLRETVLSLHKKIQHIAEQKMKLD